MGWESEKAGRADTALEKFEKLRKCGQIGWAEIGELVESKKVWK
jgi:hypothetical protein